MMEKLVALIHRTFTRTIRKGLGLLQATVGDKKCRNLAATYNIGGYKRIYLVHIRKTGGTTLNNLFLSLGQKDYQGLYEELGRVPMHRLIRNGKIFVGWSQALINAGHYYYAFSHIPYHKLKLPDGTFTIICFRDPVRRVISHYNMLMEYSRNNIHHPCMVVEGEWLGNSFLDFVARIPKEHLLNQLYMLSEKFDIEEALGRVREITHVMFTEDYEPGLTGLNRKAGLSLKPMHIRKARYQADISCEALEYLRRKLVKEYQFLERVKELPKGNQACQ